MRLVVCVCVCVLVSVHGAVPPYACTAWCGHGTVCNLDAAVSSLSPYDVLCVSPYGTNYDWSEGGVPVETARVRDSGQSVSLRTSPTGGPWVCHDGGGVLQTRLSDTAVTRVSLSARGVVVQSSCVNVAAGLYASNETGLSGDGVCTLLRVDAPGVVLERLELNALWCGSRYASGAYDALVNASVGMDTECVGCGSSRRLTVDNCSLAHGGSGIAWGSTSRSGAWVDVDGSFVVRSRISDMRHACVFVGNYIGQLNWDASTSECVRGGLQSLDIVSFPSPQSRVNATRVVVYNSVPGSVLSGSSRVPGVLDVASVHRQLGGMGGQDVFGVGEIRKYVLSHYPQYNSSACPVCDSSSSLGLVQVVVACAILIVFVGVCLLTGWAIEEGHARRHAKPGS